MTGASLSCNFAHEDALVIPDEAIAKTRNPSINEQAPRWIPDRACGLSGMTTEKGVITC